MPMDAGPILQSVLEAGLGDSGSTAVRRLLAELPMKVKHEDEIPIFLRLQSPS